MLVNVVNQRLVPSLVTHSLAGATLLQSTIFWWVEQFLHLTEVPEKLCKVQIYLSPLQL